MSSSIPTSTSPTTTSLSTSSTTLSNNLIASSIPIAVATSSSSSWSSDRQRQHNLTTTPNNFLIQSGSYESDFVLAAALSPGNICGSSSSNNNVNSIFPHSNMSPPFNYNHSPHFQQNYSVGASGVCMNAENYFNGDNMNNLYNIHNKNHASDEHSKKQKTISPLSNVSAFLPIDELIRNDQLAYKNEAVSKIYYEISSHDGEIDNVIRVMSFHPNFLSEFFRFYNYLMYSQGALSFEMRHFLAIMASARHKCMYLVDQQEKEFKWQKSNQDQDWLTGGLETVPQKLKDMCDLNKLLCHQPWLINRTHIEKILRAQQFNCWSVTELIMAITILTHFHALSGFVFGVGINENFMQNLCVQQHLADERAKAEAELEVEEMKAKNEAENAALAAAAENDYEQDYDEDEDYNEDEEEEEGEEDENEYDEEEVESEREFDGYYGDDYIFNSSTTCQRKRGRKSNKSKSKSKSATESMRVQEEVQEGVVSNPAKSACSPNKVHRARSNSTSNTKRTLSNSSASSCELGIDMLLKEMQMIQADDVKIENRQGGGNSLSSSFHDKLAEFSTDAVVSSSINIIEPADKECHLHSLSLSPLANSNSAMKRTSARAIYDGGHRCPSSLSSGANTLANSPNLLSSPCCCSTTNSGKATSVGTGYLTDLSNCAVSGSNSNLNQNHSQSPHSHTHHKNFLSHHRNNNENLYHQKQYLHSSKRPIIINNNNNTANSSDLLISSSSSYSPSSTHHHQHHHHHHHRHNHHYHHLHDKNNFFLKENSNSMINKEGNDFNFVLPTTNNNNINNNVSNYDSISGNSKLKASQKSLNTPLSSSLSSSLKLQHLNTSVMASNSPLNDDVSNSMLARVQVQVNKHILKYADDDLECELLNFKNADQTLRLEYYTWENQGFNTGSSLYPEICEQLDKTFRIAAQMTYNTMGSHKKVDTSLFRRAVWLYTHTLFGIRYDDYDYTQIKQLLASPLRNYIKTICSCPERITRKDYDSIMKEFTHSEKVHVNIVIMEARIQASVLYFLRAINSYFMNN